MTPKTDPAATLEARFLRRLARQLGVDELSEETLAKSLGFDALTDEKLEAWFGATLRRWADEMGERPPPRAERVVQTEPGRSERARPESDQLALPTRDARRKRT